jgi:3-dehydroquinate dehydratase-2
MNGPNLNLLGIREPEVYGRRTYADLCMFIRDEAECMGVETDFFQSNHEGALIDRIHAAMGVYDGIILNAGAYTHYSYALHDAIAGVTVPVIEVHISDISTREDFRKISVIRPACIGCVSGKGFNSYVEGMQYLIEAIHSEKEQCDV